MLGGNSRTSGSGSDSGRPRAPQHRSGSNEGGERELSYLDGMEAEHCVVHHDDGGDEWQGRL